VGETVGSWDDPGTGVDDGALLRAAQSGDGPALEALCRRNWKPVYRSLARLTDSTAEAEDLTQEVFLRALLSLSRFEDRGLPFTSYLLRIADNLARDRWRSQGRGPVVTAEMPEKAVPGSGPDNLAVESVRREVLLVALDSLAPDHRTVLRLRIIEGRTTREVAALTDRSQAAVRQLQVRALAALRAALGPELDSFTSGGTDDRKDQP
jgi:RNA polymerase sigma-70 factor, ECF subfamily